MMILKWGTDEIFDWFKKIILKGNADKCNLITSSKTPVGIEESNITIMSEVKFKHLGIYIENRINFDYHVSKLCQKTGKKLHALTWVFKYMNISQRKLISNAFLIPHFSYCPLIWMFHSRAMEHRINKIHERTLRLICPNQYQTIFKELSEKSKTVSIHQINLQTLATEIYKVKNNISPEVVNSLFEFTIENYNLRNVSILKRKRFFTADYGSESLLSLAPKTCELVPDSIREAQSSVLKNKVKAWTTDRCPSWFCKNHIGQVGFI